MDAIGSAFSGLQRATQQLNSSAQRISQGEIEAEPIVDSKIAETAFKANLATLDTVFETQESILDILA
jgi:hypothetical protein